LKPGTTSTRCTPIPYYLGVATELVEIEKLSRMPVPQPKERAEFERDLEVRFSFVGTWFNGCPSGWIQDVVSLIDRSRVVVCDCSGRNANVFYEAGIAHTLGREVIPITQNPADIPFDLQQIRYIHYLNNKQGRAALKKALQERLHTIVSQ
jgi:hypothetical protein